jgi:DNA glycosylase AlkZ-like
MKDRVLTLRELNRATLARQMLLGREALPVPDVIQRLVGLQAQMPGPPHVGLWTRLRGFRREDLTRLIEQRRVVRATLMRSTLHLMMAEDYLRLRPALQPALTRSLRSVAGRRLEGLDLDRLIGAARSYFEEGPRTFAELRPWLSEIEPDRDPSALAYAVRTHLPLVQVPSSGSSWGYPGNAPFTLAESWIGQPLSGPGDPRELARRYLAAFGPATVRDVQTWSGIAGLKDSVDTLKTGLRSYRNERGDELLDLPEAPLPPGDALAPARFLPEYENLLLSHADRTRVIADEHRSRVVTRNGLVRGTVLVDGFVRGTWRMERTKGAATLLVEPFEPLPKGDRDALLEEGEQLLRFAGDGAGAFEIKLERSGVGNRE